MQVQVSMTNQRRDGRVQTGRLVKGVLQLTRKHVFTQEYSVENKADRDKVFILEYPFRKDWKLVNSPTPFETTDTLYRFRESLPAGKTIALSVTEEIVEGETIAVLTSDIGQLEVYSRTGEIPKEVRDGLLKAMSLKSALVDTERQIKENQRQLQEIAQEQQRMRENMAAINPTSQYYTRLLTKLNDQETVIETLHAAVERLKSDYARQRQELETYLSNTTIG
jgi:hypothetical protein